jgi:hypothetical protein
VLPTPGLHPRFLSSRTPGASKVEHQSTNVNAPKREFISLFTYNESCRIGQYRYTQRSIVEVQHGTKMFFFGEADSEKYS